MEELDDLAAMRAIARGGAEGRRAMALIYQRHQRSFGKVLRMLYPSLSLEAHEDAVHETFVTAFEKAGSFRGESKLLTWLATIFRNKRATDFKRQQRWPMISVDEDEAFAQVVAELAAASSPSTNPLSALQSKQFSKCVQDVYAAFTESCPTAATAIWLRLMDGVESKEIALMLGKQDGATRQYLSSWTAKLRTLMQRCFDMRG